MAGCESPSSETERTLRAVLNPRAVYTVQEVSRLFSLGEGRCRSLARRGEIKGRKAGRQWRFLGSDLLECLGDKTTPPERKPQ
jgi:excisionase family DNA binding protein